MPDVQLTGQDERVLYEAGYLLLKRGKIKAAREVFEGIAAMTPQKALAQVFLGSTFFAELKFTDAINAYRRAIEVEPKNALALAHLGEALLANKQKEEGISNLKQAVSLDPNGESGKMAKSLLDAVEAGAF